MTDYVAQNASFNEDTSTPKKSQSVTASASFDKTSKKAATAFRTISEVADELDVPQHVLRFWETKFSQVKPLKRGGGRRYYRPEDVALLKHIHYQLYTEGYTIKGVQKLLKGQGKNQIAAQQAAAEEVVAPVQAKVQQQPVANVEPKAQENLTAKVYNLSDRQRAALETMLDELKALRALFPQVEEGNSNANAA
jgi:DNA-binding transcriptional MerR regulator